jgi:general secretion pathway protein L
MAHRVIGLDLGASEVKAVVVRMALRGSEVVQVERELVVLGEDGRSSPGAVLKAASKLIKRLAIPDGTIHCALAGEIASIRRLDLPDSASRRLEQVLKFELDEVLPFDIDDAVFDFIETHRSSNEIAIVSVTAMLEKVEEFISQLEENGIAPREVGVSTLSYVQGLPLEREEESLIAVVDIGHQRTNIAILEKTVPTARTVLRGGRDLTAKLVEAGGVDFENAEAYKRQFGLDGKPGEIIKDALRPLIREIQQTLKGHLASGGGRIDRILLCGGTACMEGLDRHLTEELGIPVARYFAPIRGAKSSIEKLETSSFALAYTLSKREETPRSKRVNLRKGNLAFKGDYEFLKRRLGWIAACVAAIILAWGFSAFAEYEALSNEAENQRESLGEITEKVFGKKILSREQIMEELGGKDIDVPPIPAKDAFDIVVELSNRIPTSVVHDIEFLEIKPKRVTIKGVVNADLRGGSPTTGKEDTEGVISGDTFLETSEGNTESEPDPQLSPTDLIKQKLEGFSECFTNIRVGKVTTVGQRRRYQMDIESRCP